MGSERRKSAEMKTSLILLGSLVGLSLQRGPKCEDGTKPTCADGTLPVRIKGQLPCTEGRPKTCADGSEPSRGNGGGRPNGPKGKCDDGSRPTCADGSKPQRVPGSKPCPEGKPRTCGDGSSPGSLAAGPGGKGKCPKKDRLCCDGTDLSGQGRRPRCEDGARPVCSEDQC